MKKNDVIVPRVYNLTYNESFTDFYVIKDKPPLCDIKIGNLDIIQASALNTLALNWFNETVRNATLSYVTNGNEFDITMNATQILPNSRLKDSNSHHLSFEYEGIIYDVFGLNTTETDFGYTLEFFGRKYATSIIEALVPFYSIIKNLYPDFLSFIVRLAEFMLSFQFTAVTEGMYYVPYIPLLNDGREHYIISRGPSANFVKALNIEDMKGILFNSFELSPTFLHMGMSLLTQYKKQNKMLNVYDETTIWAGKDDLIQNTISYSTKNRMFHVTNAYEETCVFAAICSEDDRWVPYCEQVLSNSGKKNGTLEFENIFNTAKELYDK